MTDFGADAVLVCRTRSRGDGALGGDVPWRWVGRDWSWGKASGGGRRRRWFRRLKSCAKAEHNARSQRLARDFFRPEGKQCKLCTCSSQSPCCSSHRTTHAPDEISADLHRRRANAVLSTLCFVLQNHFARITLRPADFLSGLDRGQTEDAKCRISRAALGVFAFYLIFEGDPSSKHAGSAGLLSHLGTVIAKG